MNKITRKKFFEQGLSKEQLAILLQKGSVECLNALALDELKLINELEIKYTKKDYFNCIETIFKERGMRKFDTNNYQKFIESILSKISFPDRCELISELLDKNDQYITQGIIAMGNAQGVVECFRETNFASKVFNKSPLVARFILGELNKNESVITGEQLSELLKKDAFFDEVFDRPSKELYDILLQAKRLLSPQNSIAAYLDITNPEEQKVVVTNHSVKSAKKVGIIVKVKAAARNVLPGAEAKITKIKNLIKQSIIL